MMHRSEYTPPSRQPAIDPRDTEEKRFTTNGVYDHAAHVAYMRHKYETRPKWNKVLNRDPDIYIKAGNDPRRKR